MFVADLAGWPFDSRGRRTSTDTLDISHGSGQASLMPSASQKITPCLWFDSNCEEAITFYTAIFPNSKINHVQRYPDGVEEGPMAGMGGKVITAIFELDGYSFQALDGGPLFTLNPSISFMLNFDPSVDPNARENLETLWTQLSEGGKVMMPLGEYPFSSLYGWVEDRFGVSWQLILTNPDGEPRPHFIPSLLFVGDVCGKAQEALTFYTEVFPDSRIGTISLWPGGMSPEVEGNVMFGEAALSGQWITAMDSAQDHQFAFNEALSFSQSSAPIKQKSTITGTSCQRCLSLNNAGGSRTSSGCHGRSFPSSSANSWAARILNVLPES